MPKAAAEKVKGEGNAAFKAGQYAAAIEKYKEATAIDDSVPAYWSNMAACYEKLGDYENMNDAARSCIKADKSFVKGYFRLATAQKNLKQTKEAIKTLESGLALDASHKDLKTMKKELAEDQRNESVLSFCKTASEQLAAGDVVAAYKTIDGARRLDAGNPAVEKVWKQIEPKYNQQEAARKSSLSPTEKLKEAGDTCYKNANFEEAVVKYTACLDKLEKTNQQTSQLALKAYANRAACYKQISNFDGTISDCTAVLEVEPDNVKALIRRAQAFEGVERYRFALQDVKSVLQMPSGTVGKANVDLCNGMQHRLQRTVDQLKKMNSS